MRKNLLVLIFMITAVSLNAQTSNTYKFFKIDNKVSLKEENTYNLNDFKPNSINTHTIYFSKNTNISEGELWSGVFAFWLLNPTLVYENKKIYFGLTKEVSIGFFHRFKFSLEY